MADGIIESKLVDGWVVRVAFQQRSPCRDCSRVGAVVQLLKLLKRSAPWVCGVQERRRDREGSHDGKETDMVFT